MKIIKTYLQGVTVFRPDDERLDTMNSPNLKKEFLIARNAGEKLFLVDLSDIKYVDSSGLGALLFGLRQAVENGGGLALIHAGPRVERLIQIAQLNQHLIGYQSEEEALAALRTKSGKGTN